jgi:hypothetical protein
LDIVITKNGFQTLMDIVIADLTHTNMVQQILTMMTNAMMMVVQEMTQSYVERAPSDNFIPFAIEMYGCFHSFLTAYAHTIIVHHQWFYLVPLMFVFYYQLHMPITLQCAQAIVIL